MIVPPAPLDAVLGGRHVGSIRLGLEDPGGDLEIRGFALFIGIGERAAATAGRRLIDVVALLEAETRRLLPDAELITAVALAKRDAGGRDLEVTRVALEEPVALEQIRVQRGFANSQPGLVIDTSRKQVSIAGENVSLTFTEWELLSILIRAGGRPLTRQQLVSGISVETGRLQAPTERSIDVAVRRLRARLEPYDDVVVTVRGTGYKFVPRAGATVRNASTPSPDMF